MDLIKSQVYLVNGELLGAEEAKAKGVDVTDASLRNNTISFGIMNKHNTSGDPEKMKIKFDKITSHDITYVGIIQTARASGLEKFPIPYVLTNCHNSLCAVGGTING